MPEPTPAPPAPAPHANANKMGKEQKALLMELMAQGYGPTYINARFVELRFPTLHPVTISQYRIKYDVPLKQRQAAAASEALSRGLAKREERIRRLMEHADWLELRKHELDVMGKPRWEEAWRKTLDDIAKEMGDRQKTIRVRTWQDEVIEKLQAGMISPAILAEEIEDPNVVAELLAKAGLPQLLPPSAVEPDLPASEMVVDNDPPE